jgi:hypothetical protein
MSLATAIQVAKSLTSPLTETTLTGPTRQGLRIRPLSPAEKKRLSTPGLPSSRGLSGLIIPDMAKANDDPDGESLPVMTEAEILGIIDSGNDKKSKGKKGKNTPIGGNKVVGAVTPRFKLIFWTAVAITFVLFVSATVMSFFADTGHVNQQTLFDSMNNGWKLGVATIFGLFTGKAA